MSTASHLTSFAAPAVQASLGIAPQPARKRWTRQEYYRLGEQGWFQDQRVELIDGEIIVLSPQSPQHMSALQRVHHMLSRIFGDGYVVRLPGPLPKGDFTEPEPDIAVVRGAISDFDNAHPSSALLIVEVSRTSLQYDRETKQHLYASMAVPEYWVLDLNSRQLIVHRVPQPAATAPFGHAYASVNVVGDDGVVSPLEKPAEVLAVRDMLPSK